MLFYIHRLQIEKQFLKWCEVNGIAKKPNSLVAYLQSQGWLNTDKIISDLKLEKTNGLCKW